MFLQSLYKFLFPTCTIPKTFGLYHIAALIVLVVATVFAVKYLKNVPEKTFRRFVLAIWIVLVIGEIYRQISFSLKLVGGEFVWNYQWYIFPFQLCSSPLYAFPVIVFLKEGKLRDAFLSFLALWSFFGGLAVMIYPGDVFCASLGINIQTMVHHSSQVLVGVLIAVRNYKKMNARYFLGGLYVYLGFLTVAMALNIGVQNYLDANNIDGVINMFYISPYHACTLPVLSAIQAATSWAVLFPTYVLGFVVVALIIFFAQKLLITKFSKEPELEQ